MCQAGATDRLLRELLRDHDLCLLANALTVDEIAPGTIVTLARFRREDRPVRRPFGAVLTPPLQGDVTKAGYSPIVVTRSTGTLTAEMLAKAAGALADGINTGEIQSALEASGERTFDLSLEGARRADLDQHSVEQHLRTVEPTALGRELFDAGQRIFLIRRTVTAAQVVISGSAEGAATMLGKFAGLFEGKANVAKRGRAQIVMAPIDGEMVVGFAASEVVEHPSGGYTLSGLTEPLTKLDDGDRLATEPAATFTSGSEEPFAFFEAAD